MQADKAYIEMLLDQWGIDNKPQNVKGLSRYENKDVIFCDRKDIDFIEWALCEMCKTNRRRRNIVIDKYCSRELDQHGKTTAISDQMLALIRRTTVTDIRLEIDAAIRQIMDYADENLYQKYK